MTKTRAVRLFVFIPACAGMLLCALLMSRTAYANDAAGFFSGAYLMELCASDRKGKELVKNGHTACQSYISGVIDYHKLMKSLGTAPTIDFCVPNTVPMRRLQNIVYVYLLKNRHHGEFIASPVVTMALYEYYPCKVPQRKKYKR
jgi:hypothetical protein